MANISSQQKKILDIGVSVARAISGELSLNYRGERLYNGSRPCYHLSAHTNDLTFVSRHELINSKLSMNGKIDSSALRLLYFRMLNFTIHCVQKTKSSVYCSIFANRCESSRKFPLI